MEWHTLEGLKKIAADTHRTVCAWRPYPVVIGTDDRWVHDNSTTKRDFRSRGLGVDVSHRSHRILVLSNGEVDGID